jgi:hypothetical protein
VKIKYFRVWIGVSRQIPQSPLREKKSLLSVIFRGNLLGRLAFSAVSLV